MSTVDAEIEFQGNNDAWFTTNAGEVFGVGIQIFHVDGRYKFGDGVTALSALPFRGAGGSSTWGAITGTLSDQTDLQTALDAIQDDIDTHEARTDNPHGVTKTQVGLGNVPNTDTTNPANITQSSSYRFTTDAEKAAWNAVIGGSVFQTVWNATTNSPTLTGSSGTKGHYYIVSVAGSTNLDGITDWKVGDWAIYDGTVWRKVDNTDAVSSVNGLTGAVILDTSNVADTSDKRYVTDAQLVVIGNTSGTNTGDETTATIKTKLGPASGSQDGYLTSSNFSTFNAKESALTISTGLTRSTNTITNNLSVGVSGGQSVIGGTGVGDALTYKSTTGNGTTTVAGHIFTGGNNGVTTIMQMYNNGNVNIGGASSTNQLSLRVGSSLHYVDLGAGTSNAFAAIHLDQSTPSTSNYAIAGEQGTGSLYLNATNIVRVRINGVATDLINVSPPQLAFTVQTQTSAATTPFVFTTPASTGQTAGTETVGFNVDMRSIITHASNTGITIQRDAWFRGRTHAFASATGTITTGTTMYVDPVLAGNNGAITNALAAIFNGNTAIVNAGVAPTMGGGTGVLFMANAGANPSTNPTGGGILYVDGGALKYRGSSGTVTTIANA